MNMMTTMELPPLALPLEDVRRFRKLTEARRARALDDARRAKRFYRMVALFQRDEIEAAVDALISWLDATAGDLDLERTGDEDDFTVHAADGPGCPIADIDCGVEDAGPHGCGDVTYTEWHTLPALRRRSGNIDGRPIDAWFGPGSTHEDTEDADSDRCMAADDDPARIIRDGHPGDALDTELNGDEGDHSGHHDS